MMSQWGHGFEGRFTGAGCSRRWETVRVERVHVSVNNPVWRCVCVEQGLAAFWSLFHRKVSYWAARTEARWSLCWFWARKRSLCLLDFFFCSLVRCPFPEPPAAKQERDKKKHINIPCETLSGMWIMIQRQRHSEQNTRPNEPFLTRLPARTPASKT